MCIRDRSTQSTGSLVLCSTTNQTMRPISRRGLVSVKHATSIKLFLRHKHYTLSKQNNKIITPLNQYNYRSYTTANQTETDSKTLIITDPQFVFEPSLPEFIYDTNTKKIKDVKEEEQDSYVSLDVHEQLYNKLLKNQEISESAEDSDQAINYFFFGERGEIFQYDYAGYHRSLSGLTCIIDPNSYLPPYASWDDFHALFRKLKKQQTDDHATAINWKEHGFPGLIFVGQLEQSYGLEGAQVYTMKRYNNNVVGVLLQSYYESDED
eukprot:TRINITY_DN3279_c0_g1_i1.p1 TRINITY_DN3279_c0_g1~~TRINITY_DN3279_c0_g1_i1.p1  ORF type:complete len:266 (-),score=42.42 TRINITY_DN3279_c0_g1_i1:35-832(-)